MPGVALSSTLIATDAPLLLFWSAALYFFFSARGLAEREERFAAPLILLGAAIGLGFLSKYAMIYFIGGLIVAAIVDPTTRRLAFSGAGVAAAVLAVALILPNVAWNAANDFQTLSHTAANANWGGTLFRPLKLLEFLFGQFGVAGPILLAIMAAALARGVSERSKPAALLAAFILPALAIVSVQAFIARAHANWASVAYPGAVVLASAFALNAAGRWRRALQASTALHIAAGAAFLAIIAVPGLADSVGLGGAFKRLRGWEAHGAAIIQHADGYDAIMMDDREVMGGILYYARARDGEAPRRFVALESNNRIDHHYEAFHRVDPARDKRIFYVTRYPKGLPAKGRFETITPVGGHTADLGGGGARTLLFFEVSGPTALLGG